MQNVQECWAREDALCNDVGVQMMSQKLKMLQYYRKDKNMSTTTSDAEQENDTNDQP